ncbi:hypothetical protein [Halofilum ochraceum]|uniref:hypothetical protein n=1 Tax=Halofilum ochraceum TaxID=1611323 RepID=UPI0008D939F2|nr:hypothetical protein [Halofilum ochraceum]
MKRPSNQRGVALFTVVFLIVVVGGLAVSLGLISGQQQLTTVQTLEQTRAYYAARARLDTLIATVLDPSNNCPVSAPPPFEGFTIEQSCDSYSVNEGGAPYEIYELEVSASSGKAGSGTLVHRSIRVQVTSGP